MSSPNLSSVRFAMDQTRFLEMDIVEKHHWLSHAEFMQALTFGQITTGPVMIAIPYIAYKFSGVGGAALSLLFDFSRS